MKFPNYPKVKRELEDQRIAVANYPAQVAKFGRQCGMCSWIYPQACFDAHHALIKNTRRKVGYKTCGYCRDKGKDQIPMPYPKAEARARSISYCTVLADRYRSNVEKRKLRVVPTFVRERPSCKEYPKAKLLSCERRGDLWHYTIQTPYKVHSQITGAFQASQAKTKAQAEALVMLQIRKLDKRMEPEGGTVGGILE